MSLVDSSSRDFSVSIVEDESVLREELAFQLRHLGFEVESFASAQQFYRYLAVSRKTIAVLDIGLEGEDGLSICRYLRQHDPQFGIVLLTARELRDQRLGGLSAGADAYLLKPVDVEELVLVLNRLGQRFASSLAQTAAAPNTEHATRGSRLPWVLDLGLSCLTAPNTTRKRVSHSEKLLLHALAQNSGTVRTHVELAAALGLHPDDFDRHRIEVIISRLRSSVQRATGLALPLNSVRGIGYSLSGVQLV